MAGREKETKSSETSMPTGGSKKKDMEYMPGKEPTYFQGYRGREGGPNRHERSTKKRKVGGRAGQKPHLDKKSQRDLGKRKESAKGRSEGNERWGVVAKRKASHT